MLKGQGELLRQVMLDTGTSQVELAALSGVHQPSLSKFLSGKVGLSDNKLAELLACMGHALEIRREARLVELVGSKRRSWLLHRAIARKLGVDGLAPWLPVIRENLRRLDVGVRGEPHRSNLRRWEVIIGDSDLRMLRCILTGVDQDAVEMREVSPLSGVLSDEERLDVLRSCRETKPA